MNRITVITSGRVLLGHHEAYKNEGATIINYDPMLEDGNTFQENPNKRIK